MFKPSSNVLTDQFKVVLLLWIIFVICFSCLSLSYCRVCSLQPCGHLVGKVLSLFCVMFFLCFVTFLYDVLGQVWYLSVSNPDLNLLP